MLIITQFTLDLLPYASHNCNVQYDGNIEEFKRQILNELKRNYNIRAEINLTYKLIEEPVIVETQTNNVVL